VLPEFIKNGGGKVINITSIARVGAFPNCPAYCASKGGLEILTKALATELGRLKVNVNSLAPGNVATRMNAHLRGPGNETYLKLMRTLTPTGRDFLTVEEMTGAAVFLASEDSAAMHGATAMGRRRLVGLVASGAGVAGWRMPARAQCNASRKALRA
jgi:NAD(P)-dependent dehydrogenase (short-subunit alcohol dehydrogenase family)